MGIESVKPEFKYVGNMHGNEVTGKEMLLKLLDFFCYEFLKGNEDIDWILEKIRIHIVPTINPDGYEKAYNALHDNLSNDVKWTLGRANANGVDLNRNFPKVDPIVFQNEKHHGRNNHVAKFKKIIRSKKLQPETKAVMEWLEKNAFVLSINFHGGDLVANYPYDFAKDGSDHKYSKCPDDATFREIALSYSQVHGKMAKDHEPCDIPGGDNFSEQGGITNGAAWYSVSGGLQDYTYLESNCFEITVELGCEKFPNENKLHGLWLDNWKSLLNFMLQVHNGVKGVVRDTRGNSVPNAVIRTYNMTKGVYQYINHDITSNGGGDYYRILKDGTYKIAVAAEGYRTAYKCLEVKNQLFHTATQLNFTLVSERAPAVDNFYSERHCNQLLKKQQYEKEPEFFNDRIPDDEEYKIEILRKFLVKTGFY